MRMLSGRVGRDDGLDVAFGEFVTQAFGVIGSVGQQAARTADHSDQDACTDQVVGIARRDHEGEWPADVVGQRVDFGRLAATRMTDGIVEGPPFAPAAERWALM